MCEIGSMIDGEFLTDKDVERYCEAHFPGQMIVWENWGGHRAIKKIFGVEGKKTEGFPLSPKYVAAIKSGRMRNLLKAYRVTGADENSCWFWKDGDPKHPQSWREEYDDHGHILAHICADDPKDSESWRQEYDDQEHVVACTWAKNPKDHRSWRREYNDNGHIIAWTYADDPKNPNSWKEEYDEQDNRIARIYSDDPKNPRSWKKEKNNESQK